MKRVTSHLLTVTVGMGILILSGCKTAELMTEVGTAIAVSTGDITIEEAQSIRRSSGAMFRAFEQLTPEQEYFIGRSVSASILATYNPLPHERATEYIATMGNALALFSSRPETFGGWHFLIMDSDEINAFAAPGGFILLSRGMLRCATNEDELAAVIAHEIAHVELQHGLRAIKKSRWTSAFTIMGAEAGKQLGSQQLAQLTSTFESAITDVTSTLVNSGYSRALEREADQAALLILQRAGYNPAALYYMLQNMQTLIKDDTRGFARTHPKPEDRMQDIAKSLSALPHTEYHPVRFTRFTKSLQDI